MLLLFLPKSRKSSKCVTMSLILATS